ncbi:MAG: histidine kinase dimerization/phospho-acceptor domain-containing protein, partial [Gemmatimonadales bacterium]
MQRLTLLGQRLAATIHSSIAVEQTAGLLLQALSPEGILILTVDPKTGRSSVLYEHHYGERRSDDPLVKLVIQQGARVLPDVTGDAVRELGIEVGERVGSWVGAPIPAAGQNVGAISVTSRTPGRFGDWHRDFVGAVAAQLGIALQNMRLLQLLSNGKREWEQTVDAIGQAFCVLDRSGKIRRANRSFSALVDVPVTALAGHPWTGVLPKEWTEPIAQLLAQRPGPAQRDTRLGERVFAVSVLALPGPDQLSVVVFEDQTEKRRLQEQLIQSEKMSAIGQLIAGVAHDLNNPLASVVGFADYLMEGIEETPDKIRQPLAAIRQEAERAANIVRNLLSFARKQEEQRRVQAIGPVLEATLQLLNNQLMSQKVTAHLELEEGLPPVEIDANHMQQVFVNLLNNAAQAIA